MPYAHTINARLNIKSGAEKLAAEKKAKRISQYTEIQKHQLWGQALLSLTKTEQDIVCRYLCTDISFNKLADEYRMENSQVNEYFRRGMRKIEKFLEAADGNK